MKFSQLFFSNNFLKKDNNSLDINQLTQKANFFTKDSAGIFSTLSLGYKLEEKINTIIQEELNNIGFSQIRLSLLQKEELWKKSNRYKNYGQELLNLKDRKGKHFILSATCEEAVTELVKKYYNQSEIQLKLYQINNKYRDEIRVQSGLIRSKEFLMNDAYCFTTSAQQSMEIYEEVKKAYINIFNKLGIDFYIEKTLSEEMGGDLSEEFCCNTSIISNAKLEIAHIFNLEQHYSKIFNLVSHKKEYIHMGCFGIGISRLIMALLEKQRDSNGFYGTKNFNTFDYIISVVDYKNNKDIADKIYLDLKNKGYDVLLDDRDISMGKKLYDSELIGIHKRIIVNNNTFDNKKVEVLNRQTGEISEIYIEFLIQ